jgi:hypothetical protein
MNERENPNIDELLNSYIDGELDERERNEVQRLVSDDKQVAQRLRELQKTKMLVGFLPCAEAPAHVLSDIKVSLERSDEMAWSEDSTDRGIAVRNRMVRKVLVAAAMIGLIAILSGLVHTIMFSNPDVRTPDSPVAFNGSLELKTGALSTVNTFIYKKIEAKGLSDSIKLTSQGNKRVYSITCNQEDLNLLLADLTDIWEMCDSRTLFVNTKTQGERKFDDVSPERTITIVNDLITPVKPKLTSNEDENTTSQQKTKKQVRLNIVVAGSE